MSRPGPARPGPSAGLDHQKAELYGAAQNDEAPNTEPWGARGHPLQEAALASCGRRTGPGLVPLWVWFSSRCSCSCCLKNNRDSWKHRLRTSRHSLLQYPQHSHSQGSRRDQEPEPLVRELLFCGRIIYKGPKILFVKLMRSLRTRTKFRVPEWFACLGWNQEVLPHPRASGIEEAGQQAGRQWRRPVLMC